MSNKPSLDDVLKDLSNRHNTEAPKLVKDIDINPVIARISTGSILLDDAIGGGFARGRIHEIFGGESSGKTTLCIHAIADFQRKYPKEKAIFIDVESAFDFEWAEQLGVDTDSMLYAAPELAETSLDIVESLCKTPESGIIVLDSVAALLPRAESEGKIGDSHVGLTARLMGTTLRKIKTLAQVNCVTVIFINQTRHKIGVTFGNPETTPGGKALPFFSSIRLSCTRAAQLKKTVKGVEHVVGNDVRFYAAKNKTAPPFRRVDTKIYYDRGVAIDSEILTLMITSGLVEKKGAFHTLPNVSYLNKLYKADTLALEFTADNSQKYQGHDKTCEAIRLNPNYYDIVPRLLSKFIED